MAEHNIFLYPLVIENEAKLLNGHSNFSLSPQNFQPVVYPKNDYGKFYEGDSYIVLNVSWQ